MIALWTATALAASNPSVDLAWKGNEGALNIAAPAGEHVAEGAPVYLTLAWGSRELSFDALGADVTDGIPIHKVAGTTLEGQLRLSLCEDRGTLCRLVDVEVAGVVPDLKKGHLVLDVAASGSPNDHASPFRVDASEIAKVAFATASTQGKPVLLDFTAVWCPPCNLLAAEVLHAEDTADTLAGFVVAQIDVDDPSSWEIKDRYDVGGYPTVVIARADGEELGRLEGYSSKEDTLSFLAEPTVDRVPAPIRERLDRIDESPTLEDVEWMVDNAPGTAAQWGWSAKGLADTEAGRALLIRALRQDLARAKGVEASDLLALQAEITTDPDEAATLTAASLATLRTALTGDPELDRAHWTWMAELMARVGDLDGALTLLDDAAATYPDEPTWALSASRILLEAERPSEALTRAESALPLAWGDNHLRLATQKVEALVALEQSDEAKRYAEEVLVAVPSPEAGIDVRTHRYRTKLRAAAGLDEEAATPE